MKGLLRKIFWEVRWPVLLFGLGLSLIMGILTWVLPQVLGDIGQVFERMPIIKPLLTALLGVDPEDEFSARMTQAFLWVHPTVLTTLWAHEVMYCTRMPAGEIDRGTVDFLLGLPISRWKLYVAETIGWILSGLVIVSLGMAGHLLIATQFVTDMQPAATSVLMVLGNLMSLYLAVGAMAFLVSAMSDRRNRAMGVVFAILLVSFLLDFLAQFWEPARPWARLSVLEYYRPAAIMQSGEFPLGHVTVLLITASLCWTTAGLILHRRSICTV